MKKTISSAIPFAVATFLCSSAFAYTLSGNVKDEAGTPVQGASVTLIEQNKSVLTDVQGNFSFQGEDNKTAIQSQNHSLGFISIKDGVLDFAQDGNTPVQIRIFDMMGNQVLNHSITGSGRVDLRQGVSAQGSYLARVRMGSAEQSVRFTANGNYSSAFKNKRGNALFLIKQGNSGNLRVTATGFDSLRVYLPNLDTVLALTLKKAGTTPVATSSSSGTNPASSPTSSPTSSPASSPASSSDIGSGEQTYDFGYALKNAPRPSTGCGKNSTLQKTRSVENGDRFEMRVGSENREYFITLPKNYDNTKPHKLLIANHCLGSKAEDFVHHSPDYDHPTPYYGQQKLDKNGDYIFVAPQGNDNGTWNGKEDHQFVDEMITTMFDNYCVDTTRVFATGFSFGAMMSYSLSLTHQDEIRAVATLAAANFVGNANSPWVPYPADSKKKIAYLGITGMSDGTCPFIGNKEKKMGGLYAALLHAQDNGCEIPAVPENIDHTNPGSKSHVTYDFKNCAEGYPVRYITFDGGHIAAPTDGQTSDDGKRTWAPKAMWDFFSQF